MLSLINHIVLGILAFLLVIIAQSLMLCITFRHYSPDKTMETTIKIIAPITEEITRYLSYIVNYQISLVYTSLLIIIESYAAYPVIIDLEPEIRTKAIVMRITGNFVHILNYILIAKYSISGLCTALTTHIGWNIIGYRVAKGLKIL